MIDGINYYERSQWRKDFLTVICHLITIIEGSKVGPIKMLLISNIRSTCVSKVFGKDEILTVPLDIDGIRQGWSEDAFQHAIGQEIDRLGK